MGVVCSCHFWQLGLIRDNIYYVVHFISSSIASLATEITGGEILVAYWPKHDLRSDLGVPHFKIFSGGACPHTPLASVAIPV